MALGYTEKDHATRLQALVEGAQALEARWQPIRSFLADASPVSLLAPLDRIKSEADLQIAVDQGLENLSALRADGRTMNLPVPSVPRRHRAYVSGDVIGGSTYDDLRQRADNAFFSWLPVKTFLEREAFPTIQAIYLLSSHGNQDDLARGFSGKLSAIIRKGIAMGLPVPRMPSPSLHPITSPITKPIVSIRGTTMNEDAAAQTFDSFGRNAAGGSLANLAQVIDPVGRGARVSFDLSPDALLTVSICVDGRCYEATSDVRELLSGIDAWAVNYHRHLHDVMDTAPLSAKDLPAPVQSAGYALVGALLDEHVGVVCGGFWSSLKKGLTSAAKAVKKTVKKMKGPIATAAGIAAGAAVAAIPGGAALAPMATKFAGSMINAAAGSGSVKAAAETAIAEAKIAATVDPGVKKALDKATAAVAKTAAAYHVADVAEAAGLGDSSAMKQLRALAAAAERGDPAAKKVMELAQGVTLAEAANAGAAAGAVSAVSGVLIGRTTDPFVQASKDRAKAYAQNRASKGRRDVFGYVHLMTGQRFAHTFKTLDDADDWFGALEPGSYVYAAYYDPKGDMFPLPENDAEFMPTIARQASAREPMTRGPAMISGVASNDPIFVDVPVIDDEGRMTGMAVKWPTSQNRRHGGTPDAFLYKGSANRDVYVWFPPGIVSVLDITEEMKPYVRVWRPTWRPVQRKLREPSVAIEVIETVPAGPHAPRTIVETTRPVTRQQAAHEYKHAHARQTQAVAVQGMPAFLPFALGAALGVGTIAAYEWYERRQSAKRAAMPLAKVPPADETIAPPVASSGW